MYFFLVHEVNIAYQTPPFQLNWSANASKFKIYYRNIQSMLKCKGMTH